MGVERIKHGEKYTRKQIKRGSPCPPKGNLESSGFDKYDASSESKQPSKTLPLSRSCWVQFRERMKKKKEARYACLLLSLFKPSSLTGKPAGQTRTCCHCHWAILCVVPTISGSSTQASTHALALIHSLNHWLNISNSPVDTAMRSCYFRRFACQARTHACVHRMGR